MDCRHGPDHQTLIGGTQNTQSQPAILYQYLEVSMIRLGKGIFTWAAAERRTNRYGSFFLNDRNYACDAFSTVEWAHDDAMSLSAKRVRLFAHVLETRDSGHCGDLSISAFPSRPDVGEIIEIGIGKFIPGDEFELASLMPSDGRHEFWIDPRILYRLHDQTVEIFAEETSVEERPRPDFSVSEGVRSCGDGTFQVSGRRYTEGFAVQPIIEPLGDGLFLMRSPNVARKAKGELIPEAVPLDDGSHPSAPRLR